MSKTSSNSWNYYMKHFFQVLVHSPANFPYVRERGFLVGLGQEVIVQVDATGTYILYIYKYLQEINKI